MSDIRCCGCLEFVYLVEIGNPVLSIWVHNATLETWRVGDGGMSEPLLSPPTAVSLEPRRTICSRSPYYSTTTYLSIVVE